MIMRTLLIALSLLAFVPVASAQVTQTPAATTLTPQVQTPAAGQGQSVTLINPLNGVNCQSGNGSCLMSFLSQILSFVTRIGSIAVVLMVVYTGYKFVMAQGKEAEIRAARNMLLWTVIGALILLGAQAIAASIQATVTALGG
jgi:hypothetical protein